MYFTCMLGAIKIIKNSFTYWLIFIDISILLSVAHPASPFPAFQAHGAIDIDDLWMVGVFLTVLASSPAVYHRCCCREQRR